MNFHNLPLATLRTFEAVARHQSLARAAAELHLTDSAVSHQMRRLQEAIGQELLVKVGRGIALTDAGHLFAKTVSTSLTAISDAALRLSEDAAVKGRLVVACPPMFANTWLAKNLKDFCDTYPTIECHIRLMDNRAVPEATDTDIGITFGSGGWPDRWSALLAHVNITPVCSPVLFERLFGASTTFEGIRHTQLLHWDDGAEWRRWLTEAGVPHINEEARHLYCSDLGMAIDLSVHGTGLALVSDTLSSVDFKRGLLIKPFPLAIDAFGGWHVIAGNRELPRAGARLFLRWLLASFGREQAFEGAQTSQAVTSDDV